MSEVLRSPWILQSVLDDLSNDSTTQTGLNHPHRTPKLVQIIQFVRSSSDSTHMLAHLSDKFHYIVSFFSDQSLGRFINRHPNWSVNEISGAIIRLMEYKFVKVPSTNIPSNDTILLVIEDFEHVGSDGSPAFGDPRYVSCNPGVIAALQRPAPPSPLRSGGNIQNIVAYDYNFTQSLDPSDLLFLENTCTQTFLKQSKSFPQIITDSDWKIPLDQELILGKVELLRVAEYEYSDVELTDEEDKSSPKKVKGDEKIEFPMTQSDMSNESNTLHTQFPSTFPPMTQAPLTQISETSQNQESPQPSSASSPTKVFFPETQVSASPVRIIESLPLKQGILETTPTKLKSTTELLPELTSSPINTPIKPPMSPSKKQQQQQQHHHQHQQLPPQQLVLEYPDYSSW